ncbi:UNVERIFIED_CONTAM: hypothetical protein PYX00_000413 [Menopon gallinae]|uniref:Uncharacterized protein n=1 Tax=Menopon gallinae TaxID=328185 RepID=A0AAW2I9N5_9NEOP
MDIKMKRVLFILVLQVIVYTQADSTIQQKSVDRQGRDLYHYHYANDDIKPEYPILTSTSYVQREGFLECSPNPVASFIGKGLNYLLLKIGVVAIVKTILAGLLLVKVPLFFLKMAVLKTFLFPVLIAPLLIHYFSGQQSQMKPAVEEKPAESPAGMGRMFEDQLSARVWRSMKIFAESDQCAERVACMFGAYDKESAAGVTFSRALKLFEQSSPPNVQQRLMSIREAFKSGVRNGSCSERDFICHGPELFIQHGKDKMQLL